MTNGDAEEEGDVSGHLTGPTGEMQGESERGMDVDDTPALEGQEAEGRLAAEEREGEGEGEGEGGGNDDESVDKEQYPTEVSGPL